MNKNRNCSSFIKTAGLLFFILIFFPLSGFAANFDLVLQWDENTEPDLAVGENPRYKIYYKTDSSGAGSKANYIGLPSGEPYVADEGSTPVGVTVAEDENSDPAVVQFTLHNLDDAKAYYIAVTALDDAGNESDLSAEVSYTPSTTPSVPTTIDLDAADDTGISNSDNITSKTSGLTFTGNGAEGALVQIYNGEVPVGNPVLVSSGKFSIDISLAQGSHAISAAQKDTGGNIIDQSAAVNIQVDSTRPSGSISYNTVDTSHVNVGALIITATFNEILSQSPRIAITGGGPLAITTPRNMSGSGKVWTQTLSVPWNDMTAYSIAISNIFDIAGNTAAAAVVGNFVTDTLDTDGDLNRDYVDPDDDNDGMPDAWEGQYGLNPKINDAGLDSDGDGVTNLDEFNFSTDPSLPDANISPLAPGLVSPQTDAVVPLTPELVIDEFVDHNTGDSHAETEWEVYLDADGQGDCVFTMRTVSALKSISIPSLVLNPGTSHAWRARVFDNHGAASEWSDYGYFTTGQDVLDLNGDGIIDSQVPPASTDMNQDGLTDMEQVKVKSIRVKGKNSLIGMDGADSPQVVKIMSLQSINPLESPDISTPGSMPYGLIDFKVNVQKPGDSAELIIYFSEPLPASGIAWYKYDSVNNVWSDFSDNVTINPAKNALTLYLTDGGSGDSDGLANGIIIDPSGLVVIEDSPDDEESAPPAAGASGGGGGGGCFINSVESSSDNNERAVIPWIVLFGILPVIYKSRRKV